MGLEQKLPQASDGRRAIQQAIADVPYQVSPPVLGPAPAQQAAAKREIRTAINAIRYFPPA